MLIGDPVFFVLAGVVTTAGLAAIYLVPRHNDCVATWFWFLLTLVVLSFWAAWARTI
jgi:hypothetical protein